MKIHRRSWRDRLKSALVTIGFAFGLVVLAGATLYLSVLVLPVLIWHM